jgi:hypothetical protein
VVAGPEARGWLVAADDGLWSVDPSGTRTQLIEGHVSTVAVTPDGTVLFQRRSAADGNVRPADTAVFAFDRRTGATRPFFAPAPTDDVSAGALILEGVALVDGQPEMLLRREMFDATKAYEEQRWARLVRRNLATATEVELFYVGAWELGATHVSYGGGIFATTLRSEGSAGTALFDVKGEKAGAPFDAFVPRDSWCTFSWPDCPDSFAISTSGRRVAWIEVVDHDPRADPATQRWNLVVADVATGTRAASIEIPAGNAETMLVFAGEDRIAVSRSPWGADGARPHTTGVANVTAGTYTPLPVAGYAIPDVAH